MQKHPFFEIHWILNESCLFFLYFWCIIMIIHWKEHNSNKWTYYFFGFYQQTSLLIFFRISCLCDLFLIFSNELQNKFCGSYRHKIHKQIGRCNSYITTVENTKPKNTKYINNISLIQKLQDKKLAVLYFELEGLLLWSIKRTPNIQLYSF